MRLEILYVAYMLNVMSTLANNYTTENRNSTNENDNYQYHATNITSDKIDRGCKLIVPEAVLKRMEPEQEPLLIFVYLFDIRLRDAPNKGGSFGIQFRWCAI